MTGGAVVRKDRHIDHEQLKVKVTFKLILLTTLAVIGGFLFGYDTGVISGANLYLRVYFSLTTITEEAIVSVTVGVAAIFSLVGGVTNEYLGRKTTILASSILFVIGSIVLAAAYWYWMLMIGRVIVGIAIGLSSTTIPMYIAETAPPNVRGVMITMFQLLITFGLFMASVIDAAFSYITDINVNWRLMLVFPALFALLQFFGFLFMPESPRYLVAKGKIEEARQVLISISGNDETAKKIADIEIHDIRITCEEADVIKNENKNQTVLRIMLKQATLRKALIIGCLLQMFQQLCGINTVMYYSATIIQMGGISNKTLAIWMAAVTSGVNFLCTFIGIYLVDRAGRRKLLLGSIIGVILCLVLLGVAFAVISANSPTNLSYIENDPLRQNDKICSNITSCDLCSYQSGCGFCYSDPNNESYSGACVAVYDGSNNVATSPTQWADYGRCSAVNFTAASKTSVVNNSFVGGDVQWDYGYCPTSFSWLPILGMVLYLCSFSAGFGPVPWTICAEIFPNWARSTGVAITTASNWLFNLVISLTFLSLADAITRQGAYFLYAGITFVGLIFCYLVIPETKDKKMEEIDEIMQGPWLNRGRTFVQPERSYGSISEIGSKVDANVSNGAQEGRYKNLETLNQKI